MHRRAKRRGGVTYEENAAVPEAFEATSPAFRKRLAGRLRGGNYRHKKEQGRSRDRTAWAASIHSRRGRSPASRFALCFAQARRQSTGEHRAIAAPVPPDAGRARRSAATPRHPTQESSVSLQPPPSSSPSAETLLEIVHAQTEIAKLGLDLGSVMAFVAERGRRLTGAQGAVIELAEQDDMVYRATAGIAADLLGLRLKRAGSLSGLCVQTGEIMRCDDSETDDRVDRAACRRVGLRSMLVTPLRHLDTTVGVLKVMSPEVGAFDEADIQVLKLMSELIAAAMFHAAHNETNELYLRATHDALTGLPNRALFYDRLRQAVQVAQHSEGALGILNLDLDGLKPINDRFGHRAGDAAIREAALRIARSVRRSDTVARVGGDEFGVILPGIGGRRDAERQSERMTETVAEPFEFEGHQLDLGVSVGIAILPDDGVDMTGLIDRADQAMYATKRQRKGDDGSR
ncbi:GGDEF domain-containing protein [Burkholderia gladioli pv. gladioli]|nr:GGDEF domain-containing protein [Burkholderia gladioli pv. gladioli]AWY52335.1 GGDEF domain-containing protein [Burkholderia gladioli pv. gladioli]